MRPLTLADAFRFSRLLAAAGAKETVTAALRQVAESAGQKRETLLRLRRAVDDIPAEDKAGREDAMRRYLTEKADNTALYYIGVDAGVALLEQAAGQGVEGLCYAFLAPVLEVTAAEVAAMPLAELAPQIREMLEGNDFGRFFDSPSATSEGARSGCTGDTQTQAG